MTVKHGKGFLKIRKPTEGDVPYQFTFRFLVIVFNWWETGNWKLEILLNSKVMSVVPFRNEKTTSGGSQQINNGLSEKLLFP